MRSAFIGILYNANYAVYGKNQFRKIGAKRCCLDILNYRQISENLYFLLNAGTRSPYETIDYQRPTVYRFIFERIGESAAGCWC